MIVVFNKTVSRLGNVEYNYRDSLTFIQAYMEVLCNEYFIFE